MENSNQQEVNQFEREFENLKKQIKRPNILVIGQTGVGKSSLINTIFGTDIAKVSNVKPETRGFHKYPGKDVPVNIIDSEGYELEKSDLFKSSIEDYVNKNIGNVEEQIHIAWYCISISSARVLPFDLENLDFILNNQKIPVAVVFTQCDNDTEEGTTFKELSKVVYAKFGDKIPCFQVSNEEELNKQLDVEKLVEWSSANISDEQVRQAFVIAQKTSFKEKWKQANIAIAAASTAAAGVALSPIPFSDTVLLVPIQTGMAARIFHVFGLNVGMNAIVKNVIGSRVMSTIGKSAVGNLLKFIPGAGSGLGAAINVAVATTLTATLGYAIAMAAEQMVKKQLDGVFSEETVGQIFTKENIEGWMKQYKNMKK